MNLKAKALLRIVAVATTVLPLWAGCSGILGLEEATLDPSSGGSGNDGGDEKTLCDRYCDLAMTNCTDEHAIYTSRANCLTSCAALPEGSEGDESGNTVNCRLRFADLAGKLSELDVNCPAAGPGGNGVCGTNCEGFCTMALGVCKSRLEALDPTKVPGGVVIDDENCETLCNALPDLGGFDISQDSGNSQQCRVYHASAATLDQVIHCQHTAGIGPCND